MFAAKRSWFMLTLAGLGITRSSLSSCVRPMATLPAPGTSAEPAAPITASSSGNTWQEHQPHTDQLSGPTQMLGIGLCNAVLTAKCARVRVCKPD